VHDPVAHLALLLALVLIAAKAGGELATRLKQPAVLGELLAGVLLGNLPWRVFQELGADPFIDILARIGVLILLFGVGLESTVREVLAVGVAAARVAVLGVVGSIAAAGAVAWLLRPGDGLTGHLFLAAAATSTSVGITARVFQDLQRTRTPEARTILGAAIVDDIIGLVILALVSGWIVSGQPAAGPLALLLVKTLGFLTIALFVGVRVTPRLFRSASRLRTGGVLMAVGLAFCFLLSWAADAIGLAAMVGAFAAGLILEDLHSAEFVARGERSLAELLQPLSQFLVPIFFVVMGLRADLRVFARPETLALAGGLTGAAVAGKLLCGLGASRGTNRLVIALGMVPRGEVTLIYASLGSTLEWHGGRLLDAQAYSALVMVVVLTTVVTPIALKWALGRRPPPTPAAAG
jgi:Kef-type K+ transport system membrane component KefB